MTQKEGSMWRLIVGHVLPGDAHSVLWIVHQRTQPDIRGDVGGKDQQCGIIGGTCNDLFAPVTQDVGTEAGIGLRSVIGSYTLRSTIE